MPCYHPYVAVDQETGLKSRVSCGKCRWCRNRRRYQWIGRLRLENLDHSHSRFVTLTYASDPGVLDVKDLQDFLYRFRYYYGRVRYLAVGEYGEKSARGHWHLIMFGPDLPLGKGVLDRRCWPFGFHLVGSAGVASMSYVAAYALKEPPRDCEKRAMMRMSLRPAIGFPRLQSLAQKAAKYPLGTWPLTFSVGGVSYPLCDGALRYFKKTFLEFGGVPPASLTPEDRHMMAIAAEHDVGTQIEEKRYVRREYVEKGKDGYAIVKPSKSTL